MAVLQGPLADRDAWSAVGECPIEKTMALLGTKSAMLIMREAYYGTTRFDDFCPAGRHHQGRRRRRGCPNSSTPACSTRRPYQEPGQRSRDEYVLTDAGTDFMPVVWAMFEWGRRHLPHRSPLRLVHDGCGAEATVQIRCADGHRRAGRRAGRPDQKGLTAFPRRECDGAS